MTPAVVATTALVLLGPSCSGGGEQANGNNGGNTGGNNGGNTGSFDPATLAGPFPLGVWLQDPMHVIRGMTTAEHYKEMGITHWMGLYQWPSEANRYPGYNLQAAQNLRTLGFTVYAGGDQAAIDWNVAHPDFADTFVGYLAGDEPDMTKQWVPEHHPVVWQANCELLRTHDPSREVWANFGKGFAKIPWPGYQAFPGPTIQDDHNKFTDFLDLVSIDFYGLTDSYEMPNYVGIWTYGKAVDNTRHYVYANPSNPGLPVWGFVETGDPFTLTQGMYPRIPPELIKPTVWNMIVHGASGMIYFNHDFATPGVTATYPIDHPEVGMAVQQANASVTAYGAVLRTPTVAGTTATTDGGVAVVVLTKHFGGDTFVFAMADGNEAHKNGLDVNATIVVAASGATAEVLGESRNVPMTSGSFTDHFGPYQLHVYRIAGSN
ncbi:MAG: hypothetical protein ABIP94_16680 [Planctomycetota bacterium]